MTVIHKTGILASTEALLDTILDALLPLLIVIAKFWLVVVLLGFALVAIIAALALLALFIRAVCKHFDLGAAGSGNLRDTRRLGAEGSTNSEKLV